MDIWEQSTPVREIASAKSNGKTHYPGIISNQSNFRILTEISVETSKKIINLHRINKYFCGLTSCL